MFRYSILAGVCAASLVSGGLFTSAYDFNFTTNGDQATVTGLVDPDFAGELEIPSSVEKNGTSYTVTAISSQAFENSKITAVILPQTITEIGAQAFESSMLAKINLPSSIITFGNRAFHSTQLTSVEFSPDATATMGRETFAQTPIVSATFGENVAELQTKDFSECNDLKTLTLYYKGVVTIPNNVGTSIFSVGVNLPDDLSRITLSVPEEYIDQYKANAAWQKLFDKGVAILAASPYVESITISPLAVGLNVGGEWTIDAIVEPASTADLISWTIEPEGIAEFNSATLTLSGKSEGAAQLKAEAPNGVSAVCQISVKGVAQGKEIILTVSDPARGSIRLPYQAGKEQSLTIEPTGSMRIESVSLNNEQLELNGNNVTLPPLSTDSELMVVYADPVTLTKVIHDDFSVVATTLGVRLSGFPAGEQIRIFTTDGTERARLTSTGTTIDLPLPEGNLYLISAGGTTYRLLR